MLEYVALAGLAVAYLVSVFLFDAEDGETGPYPEDDVKFAEYVKDEFSEEGTFNLVHRRITRWDRVRQFLNHPYRVEPTPYMAWEADDGIKEVWTRNEDKMKVWECPKCLSFWMAIPFTLMFVMAYGFGNFLLVHFSLTMVGVLVHALYVLLTEERSVGGAVNINLTNEPYEGFDEGDELQ